MDNKVLNTVEAAKFLCVSLSKLWKMCHRKELAYYKVGRLNVFRTEDLQAYLDANRVLTAKELKDQAEELLINKNKEKNIYLEKYIYNRDKKKNHRN